MMRDRAKENLISAVGAESKIFRDWVMAKMVRKKLNLSGFLTYYLKPQ